MPTGIEEVVGVLAGIGAFIVSLPKEFLYFVFLGGLALDSFVVTNLLGFSSGGFGTLLSILISNTFGIPDFVVTSFQLLVLFTIVPVVWFILSKSGRR